MMVQKQYDTYNHFNFFWSCYNSGSEETLRKVYLLRNTRCVHVMHMYMYMCLANVLLLSRTLVHGHFTKEIEIEYCLVIVVIYLSL
jgi:hypothetical protein